MKSKTSYIIITLGAFITFLAGLCITWCCGSWAARNRARELLSSNALEMKAEVEYAADEYLFAIGSAITRHYAQPEKMSVDTVREIMHRYDIDELNIVDSNGKVLAGELANVGFDFHSNSNTVE